MRYIHKNITLIKAKTSGWKWRGWGGCKKTLLSKGNILIHLVGADGNVVFMRIIVNKSHLSTSCFFSLTSLYRSN